MNKYQIPTARYGTFTGTNLSEGDAFLDTLAPPYVLKADGLAARKGVVILNDLTAAKEQLHSMIVDREFGAASDTVVIEEYMDGIECSVFALCDGDSYLLLPEAKDYKRIHDGDIGLNTGGMGSVSPVPFCHTNDGEFLRKVEERIVVPTLKGMNAEGTPYTGFLFVGLMCVKGEPYVIEYNCRMGDPETESVLPRIASDLIAVFIEYGKRNLGALKLQIHQHITSVCVIVVAGGYPGKYEKGLTIHGLEDPTQREVGVGAAPNSVLVIHAGTKVSSCTSSTGVVGNVVVTNGGRVLAVVGLNDNIQSARDIAYKRVMGLCFDNMHYRKDIGCDLMKLK